MALKRTIYLDYAAGTPVHDAVLKQSLKVASLYYYNPSAVYQGAYQTAQLLADCRRRLSSLLSVKAQSLHFTAGATEANNLLALSLRQAYPQASLAGLNIDHDSWKLHSDYLLPVNPQTAQVNPRTIIDIKDDVCCLSLAGINHELGVIQPFAKIKRAIHQARHQRLKRGHQTPLWLHVDASQMALVHNLQPQALAEADFVTFNGAKFYAFRQSGLLYIRSGIVLPSSFKGGGQERGWRPGTESVMHAQGLSLALELVMKQQSPQVARLKKLQTWFERELQKLGGQVVLGNFKGRSPHISTVLFAGFDNEVLALKLSHEGIYVGLGSACHSQDRAFQNSALYALGYKPQQIYSTLRFSFGYETTRAQLRICLQTLAKLLRRSSLN